MTKNPQWKVRTLLLGHEVQLAFRSHSLFLAQTSSMYIDEAQMSFEQNRNEVSSSPTKLVPTDSNCRFGGVKTMWRL